MYAKHQHQSSQGTFKSILPSKVDVNKRGLLHDAENRTMFGHYTAPIRKEEDTEEVFRVASLVQESFANSKFASRNNSVALGMNHAVRSIHQRCDTVTSTADSYQGNMRDRIAAAQNKRRQSPSIAAAKFFPRDFFYNKDGPKEVVPCQQPN